MGTPFHQRVALGFRAIALDNPKRCISIDASQELEIIHKQIIVHVNHVFNLGL
jgi:thymidylate kinase